MKNIITRIRLLLLLTITCLATSVSASETAPNIVIRGILELGSTQRFSLTNAGGTHTTWVKVGEKFEGYTLKSYNSEKQMLLLEKDGESFEIGMASETVSEGTDSSSYEERLVEANEMMNAFNFDELMKKTMDAQMGAMRDMMRQQMQQMGNGKVDEELLAFQSKIMTNMFEGVDWEPVKKGMAEAYAEVFTKSELAGFVDFYSTPAGKASIEKQPELQKKIMPVMMPMVMEASTKVQKEMMEFQAQRKKAKAETTATK